MAHSDIFLCGQSSDALLAADSVITEKKEQSSFVHDISFQETKTLSFRWYYTLIYISTKYMFMQ